MTRKKYFTGAAMLLACIAYPLSGGFASLPPFEALFSEEKQPGVSVTLVQGGKFPLSELREIKHRGVFADGFRKEDAATKAHFEGKWTVALVGTASTYASYKYARSHSLFMHELNELLPETNLVAVQLERQSWGASFGNNIFMERTAFGTGYQLVDHYFYAGSGGWLGGTDQHFEPQFYWLQKLMMGALGQKEVQKRIPIVVIIKPDLSVVGFRNAEFDMATNLHPQLIASVLTKLKNWE